MLSGRVRDTESHSRRKNACTDDDGHRFRTAVANIRTSKEERELKHSRCVKKRQANSQTATIINSCKPLVQLDLVFQVELASTGFVSPRNIWSANRPQGRCVVLLLCVEQSLNPKTRLFNISVLHWDTTRVAVEANIPNFPLVEKYDVLQDSVGKVHSYILIVIHVYI